MQAAEHASRSRPGAVILVDAGIPMLLLLLAFVGSALGPAVPWTAGVLAVVVAGTAVSLRVEPARAWVWAASIPLAARMLFGSVAPSGFPAGLAQCADPLSPASVWRLAEAACILGTLAVVAVAVRARPRSILLGAPTRRVAAASIAAPLVVVPFALVAGPVLARPFFGQFSLDIGTPGALLPALAFAVANGAMEEIVYRGAMLSWSERLVGPAGALWLQAILFGIAHGSGHDYVASPLPVMAGLVGAGLVAGLVVRRTGSLALPIAIHVACDVPLYYYQACRVA